MNPFPLLFPLLFPPPPALLQDDPGRLVVLNKAESTAVILALPGGERLATLPTGIGPHEVAVTPDGRHAVVADYGAQEPGSSLTVLDLERLEVARKIDLGQPVRPHGLAFEPDGAHLWVSAELARQAWRVAWAGGAVVEKHDTQAQGSHMLVYGGAAPRVYVSNLGSGSVSAFTPGRPEVQSIATGAGAEGIDLAPNGQRLWVSNRDADTLTVLSTADGSVVKELPCPGFPIRVELGAGGGKALVSCPRAGEVALFDAEQIEPLGRIAINREALDEGAERLFGDRFGHSPVPIGLTWHPNGKTAYVALSGADCVAVLDVESLKVTAFFAAGKEPDGIAWAPAPRP